MSDRKNDGFRISETIRDHLHHDLRKKLASRINKIIRRRMAEAWSHGYFSELSSSNPYHGRKKREDGR